MCVAKGDEELADESANTTDEERMMMPSMVKKATASR
jgi:hypothetical protein